MTRRQLLHAAFVFADLCVLIAALLVAAQWIAPVYALAPEGMLNARARLLDVGMVLLLMPAWILVFRHFGLYRHRYMSFMKFRHYHLLDLLKATSLGTLLLIGAAFLAELRQVTAESVLVFWAAVTLATLLSRETLSMIVRQMRLNGRNLRHLLIVGTNSRAQAFAKRVDQHPELGYSLRGFVDDDWSGCAPMDIAGHDVVANLHTVGEYLKHHVVDEVLIALPMATLYQEASRIVRLCEVHGIVVHFVPGFDFLNMESATATFSTLNDDPVITLVPPPMSGWQLAGKRTVDIVGAALLILLLSPVLLLVAALVKSTSHGPILFIQERVGLNKRKFPMMKFRTMSSNAEALQKSLEHLNEASGPVFKIENDPRITPVGRFLRRTSLDELPQLFNVLLGDMSLVGPRPLPLRDYAGFDQDWHRRRFSVRPGITCLWQVRGRSSVSFEKWMELDMEYIKNWSFWLDMKILLQTVRAVLAQKGAV